MDGILVSKPIGSLHCIIHVPPPIILVHVSQGSIDTSLSSYSVASSGEKFGNTCGVETSLGKTEGRSKTSSSSTDDNGIIFVVLSIHQHRVYKQHLDSMLYLQRLGICCSQMVRLPSLAEVRL